jgi:hypothetical protein
MNERTKKLAIIANPSSQEIYESDSWQFNCAAWSADDLEKFAELIVRECIAQIEIEKGNPYRNMGDENRYGIGACVESIRRIKQHFGVE